MRSQESTLKVNPYERNQAQAHLDAAINLIKPWTREQEKARRYHWHEYFLALRGGDSGEEHRTIAEDLEKEKDLSFAATRVARGPRKTPLLDRARVKQFLLEYARIDRAHRFHQVSETTLVAANEALRAWLINHIRRVPSKGKRI